MFWDCLLLTVGSSFLATKKDSQPRAWGLVLVATGTVGIVLHVYEGLLVLPGAWYLGLIIYTMGNIAAIALSPVQLLLLLFLRSTPKPKTGIITHHPKSKEPLGEDAEKIHFDIVAVHGLGSNPDWAWKHEESGTVWLKDLLPKAFPNARIMAFNHNSRWDIDAAVKSVENCGKELLDILNLERKGDLQKRPIIFIGHSFGGIIIKKALVTAGGKNNDRRYKNLEDSMAGAIFLGVPHDGSRLTAFGKLMSYCTYWLGSSTELLESLEPGTKLLRELNNQFLEGYQEHRIVSFWETHMTKKWGIPLLQAVDENSGTIPGKTKMGLNCDHVGINKFESEDDNNYKLVKGEMEKMVEDILEEVLKAEAVHAKELDAEEKECLESLTFPGMNLRQEDVSNPVESTFSWIWGNENFAKWRGESSGVFWVLGKPGSGKSTFTKHILEGLDNDRKSGDEPSAAVASFFFNSRGGSLEKSSRGFLQSLLYQIITQIPALVPNILEEYKSQRERSGKDIQWPLEMLFRLLLSSVTDPINKSTCIFIDALDECEKSSMVEVRRYLTQLSDVISSSSGNLKLFITTRPEPRLQGIIDMHENEIQIFHKITLQHLNNSDLEVYVKKQMKMFPESRKEYIERELLNRADGVFLWVVLAINMLEEVVHGASSLELEKKLNSIPSELDELYTQILNKVPVEYHDEAKTMFKWALLAESPLWLPDFRYAVAVSRHKFSSRQEIEESPKVQKLDETKHRIRMVSGGLLEVKFGRVQPIHQSVKDFLLVDKKEMGTKYSYTEFQISKQQGHANLATTCILYLQFDDFQFDRGPGTLSSQSKAPFLDYAIFNWIYHARICDESDTLYIRTMHRFLWYKSGSLWRNWNTLKNFKGGRGKQLTSGGPIFTLYENHMFRLIARTIADGSYANIPNFYRDALQAAAHFGYENEVTILLGYGADINVQGGIYGSALQAAVCGGHYETVEFLVANRADVDLEGGTYGNALAAAAYYGYHDIVKFLVGVGADINGQSDCHSNALQSAAYRGHHGIVQFLVRSGADINSQGGNHGSALHAAVCNGYIKIVHFLVKNGADLNAQGGIHGNSLNAAFNNGHAEVAQFLIENGANFHFEGSNSKNYLESIVYNRCPEILQFLIKNWADIKGDSCNALQIASNQGSIEITRTLVKSGADVNAEGGKYGNALHAASSGGHLEVSRFLVDNGANANAQSYQYGGVLHSAASGGHLEILRFLVENGADVNARGGAHGNALQAAAYNHLEVSRFLIECGANVNAQGGLCGDALHASLAGGHMEIVQLLVEKGAAFDSQSNMNGFLLETAVSMNRLGVVRFLIENGVNVNLKIEQSLYWSAFRAATYGSKHGVARPVTDNRANENTRFSSFFGVSSNALHNASIFGNLDISQLLVEKGANVNAQGGKYGNPLQAAVSESHLKVVQLLVEKGADVNAPSAKYGNALYAASSNGHLEISQFLVENGADVNAQGGKYGNALQAAVSGSHLNVAQFLVENGAVGSA